MRKDEAVSFEETFHIKSNDCECQALTIVSAFSGKTLSERNIQHTKMNLCSTGRPTQKKKTLHANLILSETTQLITVLLPFYISN